MLWIRSSLTCDSSFSCQEIPRILWNYKIHYPVQQQLTTRPFEEQNPTILLLYYAYVRLNMFRAPLCPSSGAHDDSVCYHIGRLVLELLLDGSLSAGRMGEFPDRRL